MFLFLLACGAELTVEAPPPTDPVVGELRELCAALQACAVEHCTPTQRGLRIQAVPVATSEGLALRGGLATQGSLDEGGSALAEAIEKHHLVNDASCSSVHAIWKGAAAPVSPDAGREDL